MRDRKEVEMIKKMYPIGTRIKLNYMEDNFSVPAGTTGTVDYVDDEGQIGMIWDNGRTLSLVYGVDSFSKIESKNVCKTVEVIELKKDYER
jgi:hypothetical protein